MLEAADVQYACQHKFVLQPGMPLILAPMLPPMLTPMVAVSHCIMLVSVKFVLQPDACAWGISDAACLPASSV